MNQKEQLDLKSTQLRQLHEKQAELRSYAAAVKGRAETVYAEKGMEMPESLRNAPLSLYESDDLRKSKEVHWENEANLFRGQNGQLYAEIKLLKDILRDNGQFNPRDETRFAEEKINSLHEMVELETKRVKELELKLEMTDRERSKLAGTVGNLEAQSRQGSRAESERVKQLSEDLAKSEQIANVQREILEEVKRSNKTPLRTGSDIKEL